MKQSIQYLDRCFYVVIIMFLGITSALSQHRDLDREVLAYILPGFLEIPAEETGRVSIDRVAITSNRLSNALEELSISEIGRAFPDWAADDSLRILDNGRAILRPRFERVFIIYLPANLTSDLVIQRLQDEPGIAYVEPHMDARLFNDPEYPDQWHLNNTGQGNGVPGADIRAEQTWDIFTGSSDIIIGIFDSGVELSHSDFTGKITGDGLNSVNNAHGTHVAGIAAAHANNGHSGRGVDWNAQIDSRRLFNNDNFFDSYIGDDSVSIKISDAVENGGVHVLNNSWGAYTFSTTIRRAFAYAYKMNRVSTAGMGNDYEGHNDTFYPAGFGQGVIAVGATQNTDERSPFSQTGNHINVTAPGGINTFSNSNENDILSTWKNNDTKFVAGTSMATPQVSGAASLLLGYDQNLYNDDVQNIIQLSADKVGSEPYTDGWNEKMGHGRLNVFRALQRLNAPYVLNHYTETGGSVYDSTVGVWQRFYDVPGLYHHFDYIVNRYEVRTTVNIADALNEAHVWGTGVATTGFTDGNPNYGMGHTNVVSSDNSTATLQTYVYKVWDTGFVGWFPAEPKDVVFAYTVHGFPTEIGGPSEVITFQHPVTIEDGNSLTILAGTELNLHGDLIVENAASLEIEEGVTINFMENDVRIISNGQFIATGTSSQRITIDHNGHSGNRIQANRGAQIQRADIIGTRVEIIGPGHAYITFTHFKNPPSALSFSGLDYIDFRGNYIENAGMYFWNQQDINLDFNTIEVTGTGLSLWNSDLASSDRNVIEGAGHVSIELMLGSDANLINLDDDGGNSRLESAGGKGISVGSNSTLFVGNGQSQQPTNNSIFNDDPEEYLIENFNSSHEVEAQNTYWGSSSPTGSMFYGLVDYSNHNSSDQTGSAGSNLAKTVGDQQDSPEQQRREMLLELISELGQDAYQQGNDIRLNALYVHMRMDREDRMELRDQALATISEWSSRRSQISSDYGDSPQVRRAIETAMLLEIRYAFRTQDYEGAETLNRLYRSSIEMVENRVALLENEISLHIHRREYTAAYETLQQAREMTARQGFDNERSWQGVEDFLREKMGEEAGEGPGYKYIVSDEEAAPSGTQPEGFALKASYPNPFNPVTVIPFSMAESGQVRLEVYDMLGRRVAVLADRVYDTGHHQVSWDASGLPSGVYVVHMTATPQQGHPRQFSRPVMLVK